jgi:hypothetical protein
MEELPKDLFDFAAQAGGIMTDIQQLSVSLTDLSSSADAVHESFGKTWATIDAGARLQGLSSVTGVSVAKLYEFEQGLEAVGRKGKYLPTIFADMQRALSHTNGTSHAEAAFAKLNLDPDQLRKEGTSDAVLDFAAALGKLDPNQATQIGNQIFGRFQTESILAIARKPELFRQVMHDSSETGASMEKFSKQFEDVKTSRMGIDNELLGIRTELSGKLAPDILSIYTRIRDDIKTMRISFEAEDFLNHNGLPAGSSTAAEKIDPGLERNHYRPEFTFLEKMGFIMSGSKVHNPYNQRQIDLLQQIAHNTSRSGIVPGIPGPPLRRDPILSMAEVSNMV